MKSILIMKPGQLVERLILKILMAYSIQIFGLMTSSRPFNKNKGQFLFTGSFIVYLLLSCSCYLEILKRTGTSVQTKFLNSIFYQIFCNQM